MTLRIPVLHNALRRFRGKLVRHVDAIVLSGGPSSAAQSGVPWARAVNGSARTSRSASGGNAPRAVGERVMASLETPQTPPFESMITLPPTDLATLDESIMLALDDYHVIEGGARLTRHLPSW